MGKGLINRHMNRKTSSQNKKTATCSWIFIECVQLTQKRRAGNFILLFFFNKKEGD